MFVMPQVAHEQGVRDVRRLPANQGGRGDSVAAGAI
jgi:hypothetical protein